MKFRRWCSNTVLPGAGQKKRSSSAHAFTHAFTLVELLVVIGIIALLISILLPALSSARRQAATVKCEASLRDIGNAFIMYVGDNNGWACPAKLIMGAGTYNLYNASFTGTQSAYWFNFLSKYETRTAVGWAGTTAGQQSDAQKSIFWGCPAWQGYIASGASGLTGGLSEAGGIEVTQTGYGMNGFPEYTPSYPPKGAELGEPTLTGTLPEANQTSVVMYSTTYGWTPPSSGLEAVSGTPYGKWYKFSQYSHPAERGLISDSLFWFMESLSPLPPQTPPVYAGQYALTNNRTWASELDGGYESTIDEFRHGVYPKLADADMFSRNGGKVAFNVLFCDNHVQTMTTKDQAYRVVRMRFPY